ncbi:type IV pilus twitching motility protein PilT, partial [Xenorhabdus sp. NBAII XenSa04]|uniref:type IV pilus twitching motility protein PilT n=1 Tax=Xenorhabdus sp. NBAII XenSa04 TaxID=1429873 RepID=UPI0006476F47
MNMEKLVALSVKHNASDLHLCVGQVPILRINDMLYPQTQLSEIDGDFIMAWSKAVLPEEQQQQLQIIGHVDFVVEMQDKRRLRGNLFYQQDHISLVLRLIPDKCPTLEQLYAPEVIQRLILQEENNLTENGLILVTGATGSGKSTTLSAMINALNNHVRKHIVTLEDPIEFVHRSRNCLIQQRQIGKDVPDYQTALKGALRQDPDVILLGELRDKETIRLALTAAETGHLVLSTLHTRGAIQAIDRLVDRSEEH